MRTDAGQPVTHGQVLEGAAAKAGFDIAVQRGRPSYVLCKCSKLVEVGARGTVPTQCKACVMKSYKEANADKLKKMSRLSQAKWVAENREEKKRRDRVAYRRKVDSAMPDDGLALPSFEVTS